jgi:flagellin
VIVDPGVSIYTTDPIPAGTHVTADILPTLDGLTVTVGQAVGQTMTIPQINLRDGAMGAIISQDASGNYLVDVTDASAIGAITNAIQDVANERASLGASQSRLELASTTLQVEFENLESAISRIRDVDVAEESTQFAKYNILVQSGTAMLAQANQTPQAVLKLLQ